MYSVGYDFILLRHKYKIENIWPSRNIHYNFELCNIYEILSSSNWLHNLTLHTSVLYVHLPCADFPGQFKLITTLCCKVVWIFKQSFCVFLFDV